MKEGEVSFSFEFGLFFPLPFILSNSFLNTAKKINIIKINLKISNTKTAKPPFTSFKLG